MGTNLSLWSLKNERIEYGLQCPIQVSHWYVKDPQFEEQPGNIFLLMNNIWITLWNE